MLVSRRNTTAASPPDSILADDSGLEVDALGGEPGVRSARFAEDAGYVPRDTGPHLSIDARNNLYLLSRMRGVALRTARYRCALALARDREMLLTAEGFVTAKFSLSPRGTGGFGYDPLFCLPQLRLTMAEISLEQKNAAQPSWPRPSCAPARSQDSHLLSDAPSSSNPDPESTRCILKLSRIK